MSKQRKPDLEIVESSGNVFADLGLDDADVLLVKAKLALGIERLIARRGLTQAAAAKLMGMDQPRVSRLVHGELYGFSTEQLLQCLTALGHDVAIMVAEEPRAGNARGRLMVPAPPTSRPTAAPRRRKRDAA